MTEFPAFEASLLRAAHRRYGWRRWRPRVAMSLVAAAAAGVMLLLVARPAPPDDEQVAWSTVSVPRYGVDVSVPPGWQIAPRSLTPHLGDPREIVTATTFVPVPSVRECTTFPAVTVGPGGALVSVQELAGAPGSAPRPRRFAPAPTSPITTRLVRACVANAGAVSYQDFSDGFRNFVALVVIDPKASPRVRVEAYQILDRLRFDQRFVPWWRAAG